MSRVCPNLNFGTLSGVNSHLSPRPLLESGVMCSLKLFNIRQFVSQDSCQNCLGCCRYNSNPSIWAPNLLEEEKKALNLQRLELIAYNQSYICCFLKPENNLCQIYNHRPLECLLYPFLLNRQGKKIYLSFDLNCPNTLDKTNRKEFKEYLNYLLSYFQKPPVSSILNKNLQVFSSYPEGEVLNLAEL